MLQTKIVSEVNKNSFYPEKLFMGNSEPTGKLINLHGLRAILLPGMGGPKEAQNYYDNTYESWKKVWKQTLLELDGSNALFSDNFTRQDSHLALFHGGRCVSAISFRRLHLKSKAALEDSWLKIWPSEIISNYSKLMNLGLMVSWFFVDPEYRRAKPDSPMARLEVSKRLTEMISFFFLDSGVDIALAGVRNNRSVNKLFSASGCTVEVPKVMNHGVEVDLVSWKPHDVKRAVELFSNESFALWRDRLAFADEPLSVSLQDAEFRAAVAFGENVRRKRT